MLRRLRSSFAAKLLTGGIVLALLTVGSVSGYLLYSRDSQTRAGALSNSDNRVEVMRQVLEQFTGEQSYTTAAGLARQAPLIAALSRPDAAAAVPGLFAGSPPVDLASEVLVISDAHGRILFMRQAADLSSADLSVAGSSTAIGDALTGGICALARGPGACGVELLAGSIPAYSVAVPVISGAVVVGAVGFVAPLAQQLHRFATLFQFPTAFIPASNPSLELRQRGAAQTRGTAPATVDQGVAAHQDLVHATYTAPAAAGGEEAVAGSFVAVDEPDGRTLAGYLGVEVPLSQFVGDERTDELTLGLITLFVLLLLALLIVLFVERVVRRPIGRLERGVERIAGGDYTSPVELRSRDELGRLAGGVNRMRDSIRRYTSEIQEARQRLDDAVERVGNVSRALTTTTGGVQALQREVVRAAAGIAGGDSVAMLALRDGDSLNVAAVHPESAAGDVSLAGWERTGEVLGGAIVRDSRAEGASLLAVPMFYQDRVIAAICVITRSGAQVAKSEEDVLAVLANNAAVAMENARLFEQERETVRRLRELDAMKNDFLATVQHELRTPLTAILGLGDLLEMCWESWEDAPKLDALRDIQVAARNLYEIVETIIDFSAVDAETLEVSLEDVGVADEVRRAVDLVAERYKDGLPIPVDVQVDPAIRIRADADRFSQVMRALLDNALKFSDGRGTVLVSADRDSGGDGAAGEVLIHIDDQGIGIAEDDLGRIFDRFFQVDNSATRRFAGTGMGLALVRRLVEAHGASVVVESDLGVGTRVTLRWPAAEPQPGGGAEAAEPEPGGDADAVAPAEAPVPTESAGVDEPVPALPSLPVQ